MSEQNGSVVITGAAKIEAASRLALRGALRLEAKGMKRSSGRSARTIANGVMGTNIRSAVKTYEAYDKWVQDKHGAQPWPLDQVRRTPRGE
jgi:hypothetical protein